MKCSTIENNIIGYVDGTLSATDKQQFELHVKTCDACKKIVEETQQLLNTMDCVEPAQPSEKVREGFMEFLEEEKALQKTVRTLPASTHVSWKTAFQVAASVVLLMAGYMMGTYFSSAKNTTEISRLEQQKDQLKTEMTLALMENRSASKRIQAVNFSEEMEQLDSALLQAIIDRMQLDANVNVRLTAAEALSRFSDNIAVRDAFIEVLENEKNPEIQIAVIQFLVQAKDKRAIRPMKELLNEPEVPIFVKNQLDKGVQQLL